TRQPVGSSSTTSSIGLPPAVCSTALATSSAVSSSAVSLSAECSTSASAVRTRARATGTAAVVCGSATRQEAGTGERSYKAGPFISRLSCFQLLNGTAPPAGPRGGAPPACAGRRAGVSDPGTAGRTRQDSPAPMAGHAVTGSSTTRDGRDRAPTGNGTWRHTARRPGHRRRLYRALVTTVTDG